MRFRFGQWFNAATDDEQRRDAQFVAPYLPYWCAGMYVLVEGRRRLGLSDPTIDQLLDPHRVRLLKEFRNGVFHFHPEYYDPKFHGFWAQGVEIHAWLDRLWIAFDAFFRQWMPKKLQEIARQQERWDAPQPRGASPSA